MTIIISPSLKIAKYVTKFEVNSLEELIDILYKNGINTINIINNDPFDLVGHYLKKEIIPDAITVEDFSQLCSNLFKPNIEIVERMKTPIIKEEDMIHKKYLPFTPCQMEKYFSVNLSDNVKYYQVSANRYKNWENKNTRKRAEDDRTNRQIEKDERFWSAQCFMNIFEQLDPQDIASGLKKMLVRVYGNVPPASIFPSWEQTLETQEGDQLILRFEENIPSPKPYTDFLQQHVSKRHFIPYVIDHATKIVDPKLTYRSDLEGSTNVDVLIINPSNGFNIFIEAKLLSDISYQVTYDLIRNQMARNIDAMLYKNQYQFKKNRINQINEDYSKCNDDKVNDDCRQHLDPAKSLFILLTPQMFKEIPGTRLYYYKFTDYKTDHLKLMADLHHRYDISPLQWSQISKRLGWLTWEDMNKVNSGCCDWVNEKII